jgi:NTE family protein
VKTKQLSNPKLIRGKKILELLRQVYEDKNFEDLPKGIKLRVCATNFHTGDEVILKSGSIAEAVRASLSVPGIFEPYWLNDQPLVDGGLVANLPLAYAIKDYKGDKIFAVDVCSYMSKSYPPENVKRVSVRQSIERSLRIFFLNQQKNIPLDPRVTLLKPNLEGFHSADILKLTKIENAGFEAVGLEAVI